MRKLVILIFLILVSISMVSGCAKTPESADTMLNQLPTPASKYEAEPLNQPDELDIRSDYTFDEKDIFGEWIGRTYTIISKRVELEPKYKLNYDNSIELKITLNTDGSGWMSTVPFAERIAAKADHTGGGAKLEILSSKSNQIVLKWSGWEYPNTTVYGLPDAGEIRLGFYARPPYVMENDDFFYLDLNTPFWETESNWSAAYWPQYILAGDIVSLNDEFLYRITFDDYHGSRLEAPSSDTLVYGDKIEYAVESGTAEDGSIQVLKQSSTGATAYQYIRYYDTESREHMLKFKASVEDCQLLEIDGNLIIMEPVEFSFGDMYFFHYYWLNLLELDSNTGKLKYLNIQYPEFYKDVFAEYYTLASQEIPSDWENSIEGFKIVVAKCYTFLLDEMLSGKFKGHTTEDIVAYLGKYYTGPLPDHVPRSDEE